MTFRGVSWGTSLSCRSGIESYGGCLRLRGVQYNPQLSGSPCWKQTHLFFGNHGGQQYLRLAFLSTCCTAALAQMKAVEPTKNPDRVASLISPLPRDPVASHEGLAEVFVDSDSKKLRQKACCLEIVKTTVQSRFGDHCLWCCLLAAS